MLLEQNVRRANMPAKRFLRDGSSKAQGTLFGIFLQNENCNSRHDVFCIIKRKYFSAQSKHHSPKIFPYRLEKKNFIKKPLRRFLCFQFHK